MLSTPPGGPEQLEFPVCPCENNLNSKLLGSPLSARSELCISLPVPFKGRACQRLCAFLFRGKSG